MNPLIYLDYQATTPLDPRALEQMLPFLTNDFGNPSSLQHRAGVIAAEAVDKARVQVAKVIGADRREVFFVSGATEANNLALKGLAASVPDRRQLIALTSEHRAVLEPLRALAASGFEVVLLSVDGEGQPDLDELDRVLSERTLVVSIAGGNSEIGTIPPLRAIADMAHARGALVHTDAAQAVGKIPLNVERDGIDLLSMSAHKLYGPKGVGALYVRHEHRRQLRPLIDGGGQEAGLRSGTPNVSGIVGFGVASELALEALPSEPVRLTKLRDRLQHGLETRVEQVQVNGPAARLPGNLNIRFVGVDAEALMANCPGIAFAAGSACSYGTPAPSHVLTAIGLDVEAAEQSVRFSVGRPTTIDEIDQVIADVVDAVGHVRSAVGAVEPAAIG